MGEPLGVYFTFSRNGQEIGGIYNRTPDMPGPSWLPYVRVKDVQQAVKKVKSAGGTLIAGPMEVPGGDWIAQFVDPQGAVFAVHTFAADIKQPAETQPTRPPVAEPGEDVIEEAEPAAPTKSARAETKTPAKKTKKSTKSGAKSGAQAARKTAAKSAAKSTRKAAKKSAKKSSKKAAKKAGKKAGKKKASKATKKRAAAPRGAKRAARKTAPAKKSAKKRSGGKKNQAAKRPRKAK